MSDINEVDELLFFDTFSHEEINDINLDLVQFPKPVYITQVRIIPLGARVQADFPGGVRLGATNPSKFDIEFFVNDLGVPGASTFEILGHLRYNQNDCIHLDCSKVKIPTDGLVLRGWYSTITLAVYGVLTNAVHERIASPIPPSEPAALKEIPIEESGIVVEVQNDEIKDDWQKTIPEGIMPHKANTSDDYDPEDLEYTLPREHYHHHHAEGEKEQREMRRQHRFSRSTEHSPTLRTRTHSESNEREYIRSREKIPRDWSRSPEYSRRSRRKRSRSEIEESHKWPHTPPAAMDSPSHQDTIDYNEEESGHYKKQKVHVYRTQSSESLRNVVNENEEETPITICEEYEPILSDDEIIGDEEDEEEGIDELASAELERELNEAALNAPTAIEMFDPWRTSLLRYKSDFHALYGKIVETLCKAFKKFTLHTMCANLEEWLDRSKGTDENRTQFIQFCDFLINLLNTQLTPHKRRNFVLQEFFKNNDQHRIQAANILKVALNYKVAYLDNYSKTRFMKMGIKLAELLCNDTDFFTYIMTETKFDVIGTLFKYYHEPHMAMSLKLMIINTLSAILDTKVAVHHFLHTESNGYKFIIEAIRTEKQPRVKFALQSIMRKLHLFEALESIREHCNQLFVVTNYYPDDNKPLSAFQQIDYAFQMLLDALVVNPLRYQQPQYYLPSTAKFENLRDPIAQKNFANTLQTYFIEHSLAESILILLINGHDLPVSTFMCALNVLIVLLQTHIGLNYLIDDAFETTQLIVSVLLGSQDVPTATVEEIKKEEDDGKEITTELKENQIHNNTEVAMPSMISTTTATTPEQIERNKKENRYIDYSFEKLKSLGFEISYKVQTRYHIDAIESIAKSDYDVIKLADHLHALYSQTCEHLGRQYTCQVIGMNNNMNILLSLALEEAGRHTVYQNNNPGLKYKSPVFSYAVDIVDCTVRFCEDLEYLRENTDNLLKLATGHDTYEPSVAAVLQEMYVYLKPLETVQITNCDVKPLVEAITCSLEDITTFPGDLIMSLRILRHLVISKSQICTDRAPTQTVELKQRYAAIQFYSADGMKILMQILDNICSHFVQPSGHGPILATDVGVHCCQILLPTLQILREILSIAVECRDVKFRDISAIQPLTKVFYLLYYFPSKCKAKAEVEMARQEIVQIMLIYTQPTEQDEGLIHKSLWTQMIRHLLKNIDHPYTFIPGLQLFAELLPLPLPIGLPASEDLQKKQILRLISERQLWSAHLHPQSAKIYKLIELLLHTSFPQLSELLQRVCMQLADLAPNMNTLIAKTIVEVVCKEWQVSHGVPTTQLARFLVFTLRLSGFAPLKCSIMTLLPGPLWDIFQALLKLTKTTNLIIRCHLTIHRIFACFFDTSISLISQDSTKPPLLNLASALPPKDLIPQIIDAILNSLFTIDVSLVVLVIKNLISLTQNDYTIFHLTLALKMKSSEFRDWVQKMLAHKKLIECFQIIENIIMLLRSLTQIEAKLEETRFPHRTLKLTAGELAQILDYQPAQAGENTDNNKPLLLQRILDFLEQNNIPAFEDALRDLRQLIALVTTTDTSATAEAFFFDWNDWNGEDEINISSLSNCGSSEPPFLEAECLVNQYEVRPLYTNVHLNVNHDTLRLDYWVEPLPVQIAVLDELLYERIPCDLAKLSSNFSTDLSITSECKRALHISTSAHAIRDRLEAASCFRTRRVEVEPCTGRPEKKLYITNLRGRGFPRPTQSRGDLFRSRPPNTSRPPSLHVDDFLALETCGAQPTGPTGYNKIPTMLRGGRINRNRGGRIAPSIHFRQKKLMRISTPAMWSEITSGMYRPSNLEVHYLNGDGPHFSGAMPHRPRGRSTRTIRSPYMR